MNKMDVSIVIPLFNEEESINELSDWIIRVVDQEKLSYEIIFIDDGSKDKSWSIIEAMSAENKNIRGVKFRRNYGKAAGIQTGFSVAKGDVVITMDADLQDSPDEIPGLYKMIMEENFDMVSGWKKKRYDPLRKRLPSKFFNWVARLNTGIKLHDFNCGLKAYRLEVVKSIEVFGEMHRYIPVIVKRAGFTNIGEKVVHHRKRKYGNSKYGIERLLIGLLDMLTISFISRFSKKPMHFFGTFGFLMMLFGAAVAAWLIAVKIYEIANNFNYREVTDQPLFYIALVSLIIGVQLFLTGFIAELVSRSSADRNSYQIEKEV